MDVPALALTDEGSVNRSMDLSSPGSFFHIACRRLPGGVGGEAVAWDCE